MHEDTARTTWELLKYTNAEPLLTSATAESLKAGVVGVLHKLCIRASQVTAGKRRKQGQDSLPGMWLEQLSGWGCHSQGGWDRAGPGERFELCLGLVQGEVLGKKS